MSLLQTIDPARLGTPVRAKAAPDRLIAGDPDFLTWALDSSRDGEVRTGIWEATPGETLSVKGESFGKLLVGEALGGERPLPPAGGRGLTALCRQPTDAETCSNPDRQRGSLGRWLSRSGNAHLNDRHEAQTGTPVVLAGPLS